MEPFGSRGSAATGQVTHPSCCRLWAHRPARKGLNQLVLLLLTIKNLFQGKTGRIRPNTSPHPTRALTLWSQEIEQPPHAPTLRKNRPSPPPERGALPHPHTARGPRPRRPGLCHGANSTTPQPAGRSSLRSGGRRFPCRGSLTPGQDEARGRLERSSNALQGAPARPERRVAAPSSPRVPRRFDTAKHRPHFCSLGDAAFGSLPGAKRAWLRGARLGWDLLARGRRFAAPPGSPSLLPCHQTPIRQHRDLLQPPELLLRAPEAPRSHGAAGTPAPAPQTLPRATLRVCLVPREPGNGVSLEGIVRCF